MRSQSAVSGCTPAARAASRIRRAVVARLGALGRPLVADGARDVGVLGGRADQRADPRRGQRDLLAVLDALDGLDRQDVLDAGGAVAPLEVVDERVVLVHVDRASPPSARRRRSGPGTIDGREVVAGLARCPGRSAGRRGRPSGCSLGDARDGVADAPRGRAPSPRGGTESSRSRHRQSAPAATALSYHEGLLPRYGDDGAVRLH